MDIVDEEFSSGHLMKVITSCIKHCRRQERETIESRIVPACGMQDHSASMGNFRQTKFTLSTTSARDTRSGPVIALIGCMGCFEKELNR